MKPTILFLCPHNAAKSVIAAAHFQRLTQQHQLDWQATSAGTEPSPTVSPPVVALLQAEGVDVSQHQPRATTREELAAASHIISMGCNLDGLVSPTKVTYWDGIPPAGQDAAATQAVILRHLQSLIKELP